MPERFIGRSLGNYQIKSLIGAGGFAWVFRAVDPALEIEVAVKVLKPQYAGDPIFEERFRKEASTAARLKHPNVIKIYSVGRDGDAVFFAMDLYTQGLSRRLEVMRQLPESSLLKLGLDLASALGFAHRQGVIHRDIKADNILFDEHGNAILADFGIARAVAGYSEQTGTNMVIGTPQFFSPEQARGQPTDARSDIYSLGVTLYLAATGELPFSGEDWYEIATRHVEDPVRPPRAINPDLSPAAEALILRCLEKKKENRFQSADDLYEELESLAIAAAGQSGGATIMVSTPATGRYRTIEPPRSRAAAGALALAILPLAFAAATAVFVAVDRIAGFNDDGRWTLGGNTNRSVAQRIGSSDSTMGTGDPGLPGTQTPVTDGNSATGMVREPVGALSLSAPPTAVLRVNDTEVGRGSWSSDTLGPGTYLLSAVLASAPGCRWSRDSIFVRHTGAARSVTLEPRRCGRLILRATRDGTEIAAQFAITGSDGTELASGALPASSQTTLPAGEHRLSVRAQFCSAYNDVVMIQADSTRELSIPLLCGDRDATPLRSALPPQHR